MGKVKAAKTGLGQNGVSKNMLDEISWFCTSIEPWIYLTHGPYEVHVHHFSKVLENPCCHKRTLRGWFVAAMVPW